MNNLKNHISQISLSRYFNLFYFLKKFWLGKFFSVSKMDKKNVQFSFLKNNLPKNLICDHNLFLWSRGAKKFFHFVTIILNFFCVKVFKNIFFSFIKLIKICKICTKIFIVNYVIIYAIESRVGVNI